MAARRVQRMEIRLEAVMVMIRSRQAISTEKIYPTKVRQFTWNGFAVADLRKKQSEVARCVSIIVRRKDYITEFDRVQTVF